MKPRNKALIKAASYAAITCISAVWMMLFILICCSKVVVIASESMVPALKIGDVCVVHREDFQDLEVGNIAVYSSPIYNKNIVHRIEEKVSEDNDLSYKLKGDANETADNILMNEQNYKGIAKKVMNIYGFVGIMGLTGAILMLGVLMIYYLGGDTNKNISDSGKI